MMMTSVPGMELNADFVGNGNSDDEGIDGDKY
jgi:hypothetical protein